jgi:hypothetical protein
MKAKVSRATWTAFPADRGQHSRVIVDKFRVAAESRSRCRTGMVDTNAVTRNSPGETMLSGLVADPGHHAGQEDPLPREKEQTTSMPELSAAV